MQDSLARLSSAVMLTFTLTAAKCSRDVEDPRVGLISFELVPGVFKIFFTDRPLCSHLLANEYFAESIWSQTGFWGSKCSGYLQYIFGLCNDEDDQEVEEQDRPEFALMGEKCNIA